MTIHFFLSFFLYFTCHTKSLSHYKHIFFLIPFKNYPAEFYANLQAFWIQDVHFYDFFNCQYWAIKLVEIKLATWKKKKKKPTLLTMKFLCMRRSQSQLKCILLYACCMLLYTIVYYCIVYYCMFLYVLVYYCTALVYSQQKSLGWVSRSVLIIAQPYYSLFPALNGLIGILLALHMDCH